MTIELDDTDRSILRRCPWDLHTWGRKTRDEAAYMRRVNRLWSAGLVKGTVISKTQLKLEILDPGRIAIGGTPIETPAVEAPDAPAA